nr:hypothetical protein CFP56_50312 [Quercus suber]
MSCHRFGHRNKGCDAADRHEPGMSDSKIRWRRLLCWRATFRLADAGETALTRKIEGLPLMGGGGATMQEKELTKKME